MPTMATTTKKTTMLNEGRLNPRLPKVAPETSINNNNNNNDFCTCIVMRKMYCPANYGSGREEL